MVHKCVILLREKFWESLEREADNADKAGAGFILQMASNAHMGKGMINNDVNEQNLNGKLFEQSLERMPQLTIINSLSLCEGLITRMRKTTKCVELSILDVFVTCSKILSFILKMNIDEKRENNLTNFNALKKVGRIIETDHSQFSSIKPEQLENFLFKNK